MSEQEFLDWLKGRVTNFVSERSRDEDDGEMDCGDLWRKMEDGGDLDAIGVEVDMDLDAQSLTFSGDDGEGGRWTVETFCEEGVYGETIWPNPLTDL